MPEISIIVPVYNAEKHLNRCIDSILIQTFTDFELILVDDGSPDNSGKICDEYAKKDNRVKVIHRQNAGVSSARNDGLKIVLGRYITFCDSDDYVEKNWLEVLYSGFVDDNVVMTVCGHKTVSENGEYIKCYCYEEGKIKSADFYKVTIGYLWQKMFKASIIFKNNLSFADGLKYREDTVFVLDYLLNISESDYIFLSKESPYLYYCKMNRETLSNKYIEDIFEIGCICGEKYNEIAIKLNSDLELSSKAMNYDYLNLIDRSFANIMEYNLLNNKTKIEKIKRIVKSEDYLNILNKLSLQLSSRFGVRYAWVLKSRSPWLIYLYLRLSKIKIDK